MKKGRLLGEVLRDVSRAFYLTLRVLPAGTREPVGIAYLLARAADTIADTAALPPRERLEQLLLLRKMVEEGADDGGLKSLKTAVAPPPLHNENLGNRLVLVERETTRGERVLLNALPDVFALYDALQERDRAEVRRIVVMLTRGMEFDLTHFPAEASGELGALETAEELERYTWFVAGCVGEFWTRVTVAHTPALRWNVHDMGHVGIRFGKALQLVNVLRDLPRDLRNGRCYLPADELRSVGLEPRDLLDPFAQQRLQPVLERWTDRALEYFESAQQYVTSIPRHCTRLRLAALWPVLIGLATLRELRRSPRWLDPDRRVKVSRSWIYRMIALSIPASFSNRLLERWFHALRQG